MFIQILASSIEFILQRTDVAISGQVQRFRKRNCHYSREKGVTNEYFMLYKFCFDISPCSMCTSALHVPAGKLASITWRLLTMSSTCLMFLSSSDCSWHMSRELNVHSGANVMVWRSWTKLVRVIHSLIHLSKEENVQGAS